MSDQSEARVPRESAHPRWDRSSPLRSGEVTSTTRTPERTRSGAHTETRAAPAPPSPSARTSSTGCTSDCLDSSAESTPRRAGKCRFCARNLDVTTDSESSPLWPSYQILQETRVEDDPATNQGGGNVSAAGHHEASNESLDETSTTGVGPSAPQLREEQSARASVQAPTLMSLDLLTFTSPPTNPVNPTISGLPTQSRQSMVPTVPLVNNPAGAQQKAGVTWDMALPIAGTVNPSTESPDALPFTSVPSNQSVNLVEAWFPASRRHVNDPWAPHSDKFSSPHKIVSSGESATVGPAMSGMASQVHKASPDALSFTSVPSNQSVNLVEAWFPTSSRQVNDPWAPYSEKFSGPQQIVPSGETATVGSVMSGKAGSKHIVRTTCHEANSQHQGHRDTLPVSQTMVVASTSSSQTKAPTSSVEMSMLSNLSEFRACPGGQKGVSKTIATTVASVCRHRYHLHPSMRNKVPNSNETEIPVLLRGFLLPHLLPDELRNKQSNFPLNQQVPKTRTITDKSKLMTKPSKIMPPDLSGGSTSRHPPGFPPQPQWPQLYSLFGMPDTRTLFSATPQFNVSRPPPPPGFPERSPLLPLVVPTLGVSKHVPCSIRPPPGFEAIRPAYATKIVARQLPRMQPYGANESQIRRVIMPPAAVGCTIDHDVQPTICPSTVLADPQSVSPASEPEMMHHDSNKDEETGPRS